MAIIEQSDFEEAMREAMNPAALEVYLTQAEAFTGVQNIWYSPETYVALTGDCAINFTYTGGQIVYTGTESVKVRFTSTVSLKSASIGVTIKFGLGKNGTADAKSVQETESFKADTPKEITSQKVFDLVTGDKLDFLVCQTSSASDDIITLTKGVWIVTKIGLN